MIYTVRFVCFQTPAQQVITVQTPQQTAATAQPQVQQVQQVQQVTLLSHMGQDFKAFQRNSADFNSFSDLFSVYLKQITISTLNC